MRRKLIIFYGICNLVALLCMWYSWFYFNATSTTNFKPQSSKFDNPDEWIFNQVDCKPVDKPVLLYNRIHKTGSTSTAFLIKKNAAKLKYKVILGSSRQWEVLGNRYRKAIETEILYALQHLRPWQHPRIAYVAHFYYSKLQNMSYTYMNMVRDPLDRYISHYFYQRTGDRPADKFKEMERYGQLSESLKDCFHLQHQGCELNVMTRFFCGNEDYCKSGNQFALNQAKRNIISKYAIIGLLGEWDLSIKLFRKVLPNFFTHINETVFKYKVNKMRKPHFDYKLLRDIAKANQADYALYKFIKRLFWTKIKRCDLLNK